MKKEDFYPVEFSREEAHFIREVLLKRLRSSSIIDNDHLYASHLLSKIESNLSRFRFDFEIPLDADYCPPVILPIISSCALNDDDSNDDD